MDFTFNEEQTLFQDSLRRFASDAYAFENRPAVLALDAGYREEHWAQIAELGWIGAALPEEAGGFGGPVEAMLVMEQIGRSLFVSPFLASAVIGAQALWRTGHPEQGEDLLASLVAGESKLTLAFAEPGKRYDLAAQDARAERDGSGYRLHGRKALVLFASVADKVIVTAKDETGAMGFFLLDADAPGLSWRHYRTQDGGAASELLMEAVQVGEGQRLGGQADQSTVLEEVIDVAIAAVTAEACGAMWAIYETTLDYIKQRKQFGQTLGSFQAIQHRMVDVYMKCQLAQSMVYEATNALLQDDPLARRRAISAAKSKVDGYARFVAQEGIQLHGGMGMMTELPLGHYFMRITAINTSFGDARYHLRRYSDLLTEEG